MFWSGLYILKIYQILIHDILGLQFMYVLYKWIVGVNPAFESQHDKTNKVTVRPAKTQISLGIHPIWSESWLCAQWVVKDRSVLHADSQDSDQTGRMLRLIRVFAGCTVTLLVLSRGDLDSQCFLLLSSEKVQSIHGTTRHNTRGAIHSPFFPVGYHQNFETYEFVFSSSGKGEFIALSFDDWNLDSSSAFYVSCFM